MQFSHLEPVCVSFVVDRVAKRQVLIPALRFSSVTIIPPALYTYLHLHDTLQRRPNGQSLRAPKEQCCVKNRLEKCCQFFFPPLFKKIISQQDCLNVRTQVQNLPLSIRLIMPSALVSTKHPCFSLQTDNPNSCGNEEDAIAQEQNSNRSKEVCQDSSIG